jgi:hypothetical protein
MFLPLEGNDIVYLKDVVALVRQEHRTRIIFSDGSQVLSGFTPQALARRYDRLLKSGAKEAAALFKEGKTE